MLIKIEGIPGKPGSLYLIEMEISFWIHLGLIVLFIIRVISGLVKDFRKNGR